MSFRLDPRRDGSINFFVLSSGTGELAFESLSDELEESSSSSISVDPDDELEGDTDRLRLFDDIEFVLVFRFFAFESLALDLLEWVSLELISLLLVSDDLIISVSVLMVFDFTCVLLLVPGNSYGSRFGAFGEAPPLFFFFDLSVDEWYGERSRDFGDFEQLGVKPLSRPASHVELDDDEVESRFSGLESGVSCDLSGTT